MAEKNTKQIYITFFFHDKEMSINNKKRAINNENTNDKDEDNSGVVGVRGIVPAGVAR